MSDLDFVHVKNTDINNSPKHISYAKMVQKNSPEKPTAEEKEKQPKGPNTCTTTEGAKRALKEKNKLSMKHHPDDVSENEDDQIDESEFADWEKPDKVVSLADFIVQKKKVSKKTRRAGGDPLVAEWVIV